MPARKRSRSSSSSRSPSRSPSPAKCKKGVKKAKRVAKRTHWLVLVKSIYAVQGGAGSTGLTAAMKAGPKHLDAFKKAFATVPSDSVAADWVRARL